MQRSRRTPLRFVFLCVVLYFLGARLQLPLLERETDSAARPGRSHLATLLREGVPHLLPRHRRRAPGGRVPRRGRFGAPAAAAATAASVSQRGGGGGVRDRP